MASPEQGHLKPGARTPNRKALAKLRADSLSTVPSTPHQRRETFHHNYVMNDGEEKCLAYKRMKAPTFATLLQKEPSSGSFLRSLGNNRGSRLEDSGLSSKHGCVVSHHAWS
ncbi:hypothetical protein PoB_003464300 [Plakobranchus ocellatus]|uniref:Uncharacterized protein n=1 Tax=Plakobranchus ocellatus TaxID=259542 RepID=A0AAV4ALG1_9GAST|nr:hypothetical protein PoB_003464300 [Plakobranchus ocellatus]